MKDGLVTFKSYVETRHAASLLNISGLFAVSKSPLGFRGNKTGFHKVVDVIYFFILSNV